MEDQETAHPRMGAWLRISQALLRRLLPPGAGMAAFGYGMTAPAFAALVDREAPRVDHALVAMAEASGDEAVEAIPQQLAEDTLIALFSRWAHYHQRWQQLQADPAPPLWFPPQEADTWRAVLLAMTSEGLHSTAAARRLWPGAF